MSDQDADVDPCASTLSPARQGFVAVLLALVGLNGTQDEYLTLIAPADTKAVEQAWAKESDCVLVGLGAEERYFVVQPARGKYVGGTAPFILERRAGGTPMSPAGAMRRATLEAPPIVADLVWYGKSAAVNSEHVEHVVARRMLSPTSWEVDVVAGGERVLPGEEGDYDGAPAGTEVVKKLTRTWNWNGSQWVDKATTRPIIGVVDCDLLASRLGLLPAAA